MTHAKIHGIISSDDHSVGTDGTVVGTELGAFIELPYTPNVVANNLPQRDANGDVKVPATPTSGNGATGKDFVLSQVAGIVSKENVDAGTTGALPANTRTGDVLTADALGEFPTVDGVAPVLNQEYLVQDEGGVAAHINNGIYELTVLGDVGTAWQLTRRSDLAGGDPAAGVFVSVEAGTVNGDKTFRCINNDGADVVNTDALEFKFWGSLTDHGNLIGLADDDHTQYHNDARGDARYFQETEHVKVSAGAADEDKPIILDAGGQVDATMVNDADIDHNNVSAIKTDGTADYNHMRTDVALAGATPVRADVAAWADGDRGIGVGTGGAVYMIYRVSSVLVYAVELTEVGA